ncbi:hypothetical protein ACTXT7_005985 [Hymenolepis weldensis]
MSEAVTIIETALSKDVTDRTAMKMTTKLASAKNLLPAVQRGGTLATNNTNITVTIINITL